MDTKFYKIEEVAVKTGLTKRALRYYEDLELVKPVRTEASYRLYTEENIESILKIKELRDSLGFSLNDIKHILDLQKELQNILKGELKDKELLSKFSKLIKEQIDLIEKKEQTLERMKSKYIDILSKLENSST